VNQSYAYTALIVKPSIVEIIGKYVELRKAGKEYTGRCPFHDDKHPSFSVNEDKGLFHCFGCQESGDVIDFVMKIEGVSFIDALAELGMDTTRPRPQPKKNPTKDRARRIAEWANEQTGRANALLREIGWQLQLAKEIHDRDLTNYFGRQWAILEDLADDLQTAKLVIELYSNRAAIESILADADLVED